MILRVGVIFQITMDGRVVRDPNAVLRYYYIVGFHQIRNAGTVSDRLV